MFERHAATPQGRLATIAAKAAFKVVDLINSAKTAAKVSNKQMALDLGVTDGRVSQVLNGDGNLRVATIARFLAVCGYELEISARPASSERPPLSQRRRRKPAQRPTRDDGQTWDVYEQHTVSREGVQRNFALIHRVSGLSAAPLTKPVKIGAIELHTAGADFSPVNSSADAWPAEVEHAVDIEDDRDVMQS
ncbi:hypothetical protein [Kribbella sp. C-35]|uniref:hypothetical protein n=1 Tax=Kribbella sp. C-35 TaxID=2789276 RepID=UPI00397A0DE8